MGLLIETLGHSKTDAWYRLTNLSTIIVIRTTIGCFQSAALEDNREVLYTVVDVLWLK